MKKIKFILATFVISTFFAVSGVSAHISLGFTGVTIPGWQGIYTSPTQQKEIESYQYVLNIGAKDSLSGDERAVEARTKSASSVYSPWMTMPKGRTVSWGENINMYVNKYNLQVKAKSNLPTSASFAGSWYLDNRIL